MGNKYINPFGFAIGKPLADPISNLFQSFPVTVWETPSPEQLNHLKPIVKTHTALNERVALEVSQSWRKVRSSLCWAMKVMAFVQILGMALSSPHLNLPQAFLKLAISYSCKSPGGGEVPLFLSGVSFLP